MPKEFAKAEGFLKTLSATGLVLVYVKTENGDLSPCLLRKTKSEKSETVLRVTNESDFSGGGDIDLP